MFVNMYILNHCGLVCLLPPRFSLLIARVYTGLSPVTTDDASCFDANSPSMCLVKLPFFTMVVMILNFMRNITKNQGGCMHNTK